MATATRNSVEEEITVEFLRRLQESDDVSPVVADAIESLTTEDDFGGRGMIVDHILESALADEA